MSAPPRRRETRRPPAISDYGFLSDCQSTALVNREGSVDWWCLPRVDSPSVFGRLLDPAAGHWTLCPVKDFTSERQYVGRTLILRTVFRTATGAVALTDALALETGSRGHEIGLRSPHMLLRRVEGLTGTTEMATEFAPRMEYGRTEPHLRVGDSAVEARGGPVKLACVAPVAWRCEDGAARATFILEAGQRIDFRVAYSPSFGEPIEGPRADASLDDTLAGWESWSRQHSYEGAFVEEVRRSSLVLQGLTYQPSGAVVAAATTSLPETMGGELNFDYRFAWLRDLSMTIRSLWIAACPHEPARLFDWFANASGTIGGELVQIMYGVEGERDLDEHILEHLSGFRQSRPVRIGNAAWQQKQLDVLGEVIAAAYQLKDRLGSLEPAVQGMLVTLAGRACSSWSEPDAGMWESRDEPRHYVSSKVMCWVALDSALKLTSQLGSKAEPERWAGAREELRATILAEAWSDTAGAYAGAFGSEDLDASVLLLPVVGFLPARDERMWATIEAIERGLATETLVRRWSTDSSGFLICTYWLAECLALGGEIERAREWFCRATGHANDLGLLSEEAALDTGELLGNFPQAFSHVGLINAAWRIAEAEKIHHNAGGEAK
ncbi:MAG: glycoside hydrolase family 15 protein [Candidatus Dormibacteria bacterium]